MFEETERKKDEDFTETDRENVIGGAARAGAKSVQEIRVYRLREWEKESECERERERER